MTDKQLVQRLLTSADIRIGSGRPWDIEVHREQLYARVLRWGALGLGEAYMDGWWDCRELDEFFHRILAARLDERVRGDWRLLLGIAYRVLTNPQRKAKAFEIGRRHYDIGNRLYRVMLDGRMVYTCGYWREARDLNQAQEAKLELVCRKIGLEQGMRVLDIGAGWGSFARFAAERYGAEVVGITVSEQQVALGRELTAGLPVELRLQDYRDLDGEVFDRVVSLGMIEHVGYQNYRNYMRVVRRCLADDGLFLLHTIGGNRSVRGNNAWTERYIFPNSMLPSLKQLGGAVEGLFVVEDLHNFSADYDRTLMAWHENFERGWPAIEKDYDQRFYRMWRYFLLSSAGSFRARRNQLWQLVMSPRGVPGGYVSIR